MPAEPEPAAIPPERPATPGLRRRMACLVYEGLLLFGVVMIAGLVYGASTQQRHALVGTSGLQAFLFVVLGLYFTTFWVRGGQTLAMKTWHIRLVTREGAPVGIGRAVCRYLLAWMWFLPALATVHFSGLVGGWQTFSAMIAGVLAYAASARLHPDRQFWHDTVCGTRLVHWQPVRRRKP